MDILHLSDGELDFELQLRNEDQQKRTKREKTSKLREYIENERINLEMPTSADHVINQEDHIRHCQTKVQYLNDRIKMGLEQEDALELAICRSKLLHYRARLHLITDKNLARYVAKLEEVDEQSMLRVNNFFVDTTMLDGIPTKKVPEDNEAILPDDADVLERLKNAQLQSSVKSGTEGLANNQQASAQQQLEQLRQLQQQQILLQRQIELQRVQQEQLEGELKIQQQLYQLTLQQEQPQKQLQNPGQPEKQQQQHEGGRQHGAHLGISGTTFRNRNNPSMGATSKIILPEDLGSAQAPNFLEQPIHHYGTASGIPSRPDIPYGRNIATNASQLQANIANEASRYPQALEPRPSSRFHQNRTQNSQPVYKWPFEYAGQPDTIRLGEFLNMVTTYAVTEGVDEPTLLRSIKHLLKDSALQWYTRCYMLLRDWNDFKLEIKREFLPPNYSEIVKQDLYLRFQEPNEPFANFYRDLVAAFEIVEPPLPESEKLFILKSHLNADFTPIASAARVTTVKELVAVCRDFAVSRSYCMRHKNTGQSRPAWNRADNPTFNRPARANHGGHHYERQQVNTVTREIQGQIEDTPSSAILEQEEAQQQLAIQWEEAAAEAGEINAIRMQGTWSRNQEVTGTTPIDNSTNRSTTIACWQCGSQGHTYPTCPNTKTFVFCYSCGNKGATTRNCQTCAARWAQLTASKQKSQPGNRQRENHF
ncbi:hypothetical protein RP20_CCG004631 [Aedes albopictus]|nr:hypothetical protein RP20_CCG004631 [Aedes albopictus]